MKYWHFNSAFFKAKIIRECPNITKFVRGWSKGGLDSLAWQYAWSGCELHMIGKIFFDMFGKKYTLKIGVMKWSPLPLFWEPVPPPSILWSDRGGSGLLGIWSLFENQIANFSQHCVVACSVFFSSGQKKWNPAFRFGGRHKFFNVPKIVLKKKSHNGDLLVF